MKPTAKLVISNPLRSVPPSYSVEIEWPEKLGDVNIDRRTSYAIGFGLLSEATEFTNIVNSGDNPWFQNPKVKTDVNGKTYVHSEKEPIGKFWRDDYIQYLI